MSHTKFSLRAAVLILILFVAPTAFGESLLKPVPQPDTAKLPPDVAKELASARAAFEKAHGELVGDQLAAAYALLGADYLKAGALDAAAVAMYDASQLAPKDARWLYVSGVIAREQKHSADARANFEAALVLDTNYLPIRYRLADTLADTGDFEGAKKILLDGIKEHPENATLYAFLGRLELKQRRYAPAIEHLQQALKLQPSATALNKDLADAYTGQGDKNTAATFASKTGDVPPLVDDPIIVGIYKPNTTPTLAGTPLQQAHVLLDQQQFGLARGELELALKADANDVDALVLAARLDALLGHKAAAQDEASRALKLKPDDAAANLSQGMVYEFAGDDKKAVPFYQRASQLDAKLPDPYLLIGNSLMRQGRYAAAAESYRKLANVSGQAAEPEARVAAALVAAGNCREALTSINTALAKRARDGELLQIFVRVASTCPTATAQERGMALDYGQALYKQRPETAHAVALALAQAANGKFDDAQKSQAEAIFDAERSHDRQRAENYRAIMRKYVAKQVPDKPWYADHPYLKPPMLSPLDTKSSK
ncbi:MAG: tetratricopeptide repeat protein [Rudaea sp.]